MGPLTRTWVDVVPNVMAKVLQLDAFLCLIGWAGLRRWEGYDALLEPFGWLGVPVGASLFITVFLYVWAATALR